MAKKEKLWAVTPEFDGVVSLEQEGNYVTLSNSLSQESLAEYAKDVLVVGFLRHVTPNLETDVKG